MPGPKKPAENFFAPGPKDDASSHRHRQAIGWLGLALPWALVLSNILRPYPKTGLFWGSISLYYYSAGNALFCGILFALLVFLFTYEGYDNAGRKWDLFFSKIAGTAALAVACFPTTPLDPVQKDAAFGVPWSVPPWTGKAHVAAATTLFACFIFFSLFLFTRNAKSKGLLHLAWPEKWRDRVYVACGAVMAVLLVWALFNGYSNRSIFWQESFSLQAFGVSWLVKSRVEYTVGKWMKRSPWFFKRN